MIRALRIAGLGVVLVAAAFFAASCGGSKSNPTAPTGGGGSGGADLVIHIRLGSAAADTNAYSPYRATISANQSVSWQNDDNMGHTATAVSGGSFDTGTIGAGAASTPITFTSAGTINYHCTIAGHNMNGILTVSP